MKESWTLGSAAAAAAAVAVAAAAAALALVSDGEGGVVTAFTTRMPLPSTRPITFGPYQQEERCPLACARLGWSAARGSFTTISKRSTGARRSAGSLRLSSSSDESSPFARNSARTSVLHFLTQRAVQSFLFLVYTCRDPHTVRWMEDFCETRNLLSYHGTGAFNTTRFATPNTFLEELMQRPPTLVVVQARRQGRNQGGWSKDNPYLKERFAEYEIEIDPLSLASRILSVREQIAKEFAVDLTIVAKASEEILYSYASRLQQEESPTSPLSPPQDDSQGGLSDLDAAMTAAAAATEEQPSNPDFGPLENNDDEDDNNDEIDFVAAATVAGLLGEDEPDVPSIYGNQRGGGLPQGPPPQEEEKESVFDRVYMMMLNNQLAFEEQTASPLRKGNFDLLYNLVTQESIHRVLRQYQEAGSAKEVSLAWLLRFYTQHLQGYFDGPVRYGRADDFIEEMFCASPSLVDTGTTTVGLLDPVAIAERILQERSVVAADFQQEINALLQDGQFELRKELLAQQMARSTRQTSAAESAETTFTSSDGGEATSSTEIIEAGDFE